MEEIKNKNEEDIPDSLLYDLLSSPNLNTEQALRTLLDVFIGGIDSV